MSPTTLGRYRLEELLGRGGMAEVYRAVDTLLGRLVAVKLILPVLAADPAFVDRFLREARLVAALDHPHVLAIYDVAEAEGRPFLVMPLVDGGSLASRLAVGRPSPRQVARWLVELGDALDHAHREGVLHRDVKPANVLLGRDERALLADFGIAKSLGGSSQLTATGSVVGTPLYMAPEVARGEPASPASDRYGFAVLAYELLTGAPPFRGDNALAVLHQHVAEPAPAVSTRVPGVPAALDQLFARALAKDPRLRPQSARSLGREIAVWLTRTDPMGDPTAPTDVLAGGLFPSPTEALGGDPTDSGAAGAAGAGTTVHQPTSVLGSAARAGRASGSPGRRWMGVVAGLALALALVVIWGWAWLQPSSGPAAPAPAAVDFPSTPPASGVAESGAPDRTALEPAPEPPVGEPFERQSTAPAVAPPSRQPDAPGASPASPVASRGQAQVPFAAGLEARRRMLELRGYQSRPDAAAFQAAALSGVGHGGGLAPGLTDAIDSLARAGLAYLDGDPEAVRAGLAPVARGPWGPTFAGILPLLVLDPASGQQAPHWAVVLALGDPRTEAAAGLAAAGDEGPAVRLAQAVLARLDGDGARARREAEAVFAQQDAPAIRAGIAAFIAEQAEMLGDRALAVRWFAQAVELAPREEQRGLYALLGLRAAREAGRREEGGRWALLACRQGHGLACGVAGDRAQRPFRPRTGGGRRGESR